VIKIKIRTVLVQTEMILVKVGPCTTEVAPIRIKVERIRAEVVVQPMVARVKMHTEMQHRVVLVRAIIMMIMRDHNTPDMCILALEKER
jgi:hypothetical protein